MDFDFGEAEEEGPRFFLLDGGEAGSFAEEDFAEEADEGLDFPARSGGRSGRDVDMAYPWLCGIERELNRLRSRLYMKPQTHPRCFMFILEIRSEPSTWLFQNSYQGTPRRMRNLDTEGTENTKKARTMPPSLHLRPPAFRSSAFSLRFLFT